MPPKEKEKRARRTVKACVICHKKKVRCDIDDVEGSICTPCARDGYDCVPRERKRKRFTFSPSPPVQRRSRSQKWDPTLSDARQEVTFPTSLPTMESLSGTSNTGIPPNEDYRHSQAMKSEIEGERQPSRSNSLQDDTSLLERHTEPGYPTPRGSGPSVIPETSYLSSTNVVSYLGRLEYLRNDVPVNDDAGLPNNIPRKLSDTDLEILRVQRVDELPPRAVRETLMDAFWARCYPWTPVVERAWLDKRSPNRVSLLLQYAMMLAGSRVSAPISNYPPVDFYKKARVLFWIGTEEDPIITVAATLLLHWWNPEGPESVSIDTSSFWLRICIGLAYQVGLHREPTGKTDAGLRRRIWWSLVVRDCLINAGHGRPRAIDLKLADVSPISVLDFEGALASADLFSSYVGISCILGTCCPSYQTVFLTSQAI